MIGWNCFIALKKGIYLQLKFAIVLNKWTKNDSEVFKELRTLIFTEALSLYRLKTLIIIAIVNHYYGGAFFENKGKPEKLFPKY